jgi:hypothetical protein
MTMGIAWLSSSSAEIARARDVLKALKPGGVIDELGFLVLQGAFADYFYPAITTLMTRPRYLVFIPAIYRYLEQSGKARGRDVDRLSRDLQYELLKALGDEEGAIGKEKGRSLVRTPSEIYWSALARLGLATERVSEAVYQRRLAEGQYRTRALRDDDASVHPDDTESMWDLALNTVHVMPDGEFSQSSLRLRKNEAALLNARYSTLSQHGSAPLIPHCVGLTRKLGPNSLEGVSNLWELPLLPPEVDRVAEQARLLSLFARGTTLQYHRMIIEKKGLDDAGAGAAFIAWWEFARDELRKWDVNSLFELVASWDADRRPLKDRAFLREWITSCVGASSGRKALDDRTAQTIIARREDHIRPGKQRLRVKFQLDSWQMLGSYPTDVFYQLQYRHPVGQRFAHDIAHGLEGWPH